MEITFDSLIIFIFTFFIVTNIIVQIIDCILDAMIAPQFGLKIISVFIFGVMLIRKDNKWKMNFHHLSPNCYCLKGYDLNTPIPEDSFEKEKRAAYLIKALTILVSLLVAFVFWGYFSRFFHGRTESLYHTFMSVFGISFVAGMIFFSVLHMGLCIYAFEISAKRMGGYIDRAIQKIRQGYSFEDLNLKPVEELGFKNVTKAEKQNYYNVYVYYLAVTGQVEELHKVSDEIAEMLETCEFLMHHTGLYYWLVYYYSKYYIDVRRADQFLKKVWPVLSKDSDANAKRVLAQYYWIRGDVNRAREYVREGLACVDNFSIGGERELEKKLLGELAGELERYI